MRWVSEAFSNSISYETDAVSISYIEQDIEGLGYFSVECSSRGLESRVYEAYHLILGIGGRPYVPIACDCTGNRTVHSENFLSLTNEFSLEKRDNLKILVVGSGQSAAEIVYFIHSEYAAFEISICSSEMIFNMVETSPFAYDFIYDHDAREKHYKVKSSGKLMLFESLKRLNASVADEILVDLYRSLYDEKVERKRSRVSFFPHCDLEKAVESLDSVNVLLNDKLNERSIPAEFDYVIYATGYDYENVRSILSKLKNYEFESISSSLDRDLNLRIKTKKQNLPGIYVHSAGDYVQHGVSEGLMSNLATNAEKVINDIRKRTQKRI